MNAGGNCIDESECTTVRGTGIFGRTCLSFSDPPTSTPTTPPTRAPSVQPTQRPTRVPTPIETASVPVVVVIFAAEDDALACPDLVPESLLGFTLRMIETAVIQLQAASTTFELDIYTPTLTGGCGRYHICFVTVTFFGGYCLSAAARAPREHSAGAGDGDLD